jgi:hypothetical protein
MALAPMALSLISPACAVVSSATITTLLVLILSVTRVKLRGAKITAA